MGHGRKWDTVESIPGNFLSVTFQTVSRYNSSHYVNYRKMVEKTAIHVKQKQRRSCTASSWRKPSLLQVLLALLLSWASVTYTIYVSDVPGFGGSDEFCDSFYIEPDLADPVYPYKNTFNISKPIDWTKSGLDDALDKHRIIGTHNSYHIQQYAGSLTWFASWWTRWVREGIFHGLNWETVV